MQADSLSDIALLGVELDTLWVRDAQGRLVKAGGLAGAQAPYLATARPARGEGQLLALGKEVPPDLGAEIEALMTNEVAGTAGGGTPATLLQRCEEILAGTLGAIEVVWGPSYVVASPPTFASEAAIRTADDGGGALLAPPAEARWTDEEWQMLNGGALGPWAAALVDGSLVALCFSARFTGRAAEAGVWTHSDHRQQGHASAVTAAWARQVAHVGLLAFYSTSSTNTSSQNVAARLALRPIGTIWQLRRPPDAVG